MDDIEKHIASLAADFLLKELRSQDYSPNYKAHASALTHILEAKRLDELFSSEAGGQSYDRTRYQHRAAALVKTLPIT